MLLACAKDETISISQKTTIKITSSRIKAPEIKHKGIVILKPRVSQEIIAVE